MLVLVLGGSWARCWRRSWTCGYRQRMRVSVRRVSRHWRIIKVIDALLNVLFIRRERVCLNYRLTVLGVAP